MTFNSWLSCLSLLHTVSSWQPDSTWWSFWCAVLEVQREKFSDLICALCQGSGQTAAGPSASPLQPASTHSLWHSRKHREREMPTPRRHYSAVLGKNPRHTNNQPRKQAINFQYFGRDSGPYKGENPIILHALKAKYLFGILLLQTLELSINTPTGDVS